MNRGSCRGVAVGPQVVWMLVVAGLSAPALPCPAQQATPAAPKSASGKPVDFAVEVLPILSNKCFVCHGPDAKDPELVRLDSHAGATSDRGGYRAIDPQAPAKSRLLERIHSEDDPMPPSDAEKQLTTAERTVLDRWVRQGGKYTRHWAFVPPKKRPPQGHKAVPGRDAIDAYLSAQLASRGMDFAASADRRTLARRAALTLTGLPPEPKQLDAFLADQRPDAYERFVDQMFDSPRFGEHQARYWLDAVRYGDTHGLHLDNRRGIFPYRDWVVRAFNRNLPLDQFITWQLAGDLLPNPTLAQQVATGFVRMNPSTAEGGVIPAEFQAKNNFDRTETLGTVLLGMTLTCARCHTHKYDPIPQTEYYRLLAFFNSTAESPLDGNSYTYGPVLKAPRDQAAWDRWETLEATRKQLLGEAADEVAQSAVADRLTPYAKSVSTGEAQQWRISGPVAVNAEMPADDQFQDAQGLPGSSSAKLPQPDRAVWVRCQVEVPVDQSLWVKHSGGPGSQIVVDGKPPVSAEPNTPPGIAHPVSLPAGRHTIHLKLVGKPNTPAVDVRLETPWTSLAAGAKWESLAEGRQLQLLSDSHGPLAAGKRHVVAARVIRGLAIEPTQFVTTLVARDLPKPRETKILRRGEYNLPTGDPLQPGILTVMGKFPEGAPRNRLGLARWLTGRDHPLVARVLVNRMWQRVFGRALVRSPEDFGRQGRQPTHPRLLDWLAVELHDSGWNMKHMLRLMVTSRAFRQHSAWRRGLDDPENRLYARGPSYRLDAEVLRDLALWSSRLLDPHMGGEGVKPYQPGGMWLAMAHPASNTKKYVRDKGQLLYRRSLYVYWKRTSPHPMMTLFDAPDRESSCVRRSRTNTSLQSLGLLNETQRIEMARKLGERLLRERTDDAGRLDLLFSLLACRSPNDRERSACTSLLETMRKRYQEAEEDAVALLSIGDAPRDQKLNPVELAAWTQVAVTVLASDVAILMY